MTAKEIRENKVYRSVLSQLAQIAQINTYHGRTDVERSVRIINAMKKRAEERIATGRNADEVNEWLENTICCFKSSEGGYTYEEISGHWRDIVNQLKTDAQEKLMKKALLLQKLSMKEKDPEKSLSISKDCTKYMEAVIYIAENIKYEG